MVKLNFPWKKCLSGVPMHTILDLFHFVILMLVVLIQMEKLEKRMIQKHI